MILSISLPSFTLHPRRFASARARKSTRCLTSIAEYDLPVRPSVNGGLDFSIGYRPLAPFSSKRKSKTDTESGGVKASLGMYEGVANAMMGW